MPNPITLTRFVNVDVKSAAESYNVPRRSSARNNLKADGCFHVGQKIFAVATDVLEAFAARTRMLISYIMICVSQNECFALGPFKTWSM